MLLIKTFIAKSNIHGFGCFAAEPIKRGTPVWKFVQGFDLIYTEEQIAQFPIISQEFIKKYAYKSARNNGIWIMCGDDARFVNHESPPTILSDFSKDPFEGVSLATRDLKIGDEITDDYNELEGKVDI